MRAIQTGLAAAMLLLLGISPADANEVGYPQQAPRFTMALPETWKPVFREDSLTLLPMRRTALSFR